MQKGSSPLILIRTSHDFNWLDIGFHKRTSLAHYNPYSHCCQKHKKAIIAIARKMLVAIYHMIRDDADFLPIDHAETATHRNHETKGLNLDNIIEFLGTHGVDVKTLRLVKSQCSDTKTDHDPERWQINPLKTKSNLIPLPSPLLSQNRMSGEDGTHHLKENLPVLPHQ